MITVNNVLANGGDGFSTLRLGTNQVIGRLDIEAFADHLPDTTAIATPKTDRITVVS